MSSYTAGRVVDGRWELVRDLGGRLPGTRWDARHVRTHRRAILRVAPVALEDGAAAAWLNREVVALARVSHPGAVDIRDAGYTELGDPYLVLEQIEGRTLQGLAAARGKLPWPFVAAVARQLLEVLAFAHDAGVVHRELAPDRVVFVRDPYGVERVKLVGWEAAFVADVPPDDAVDGVSIATDYAAPEQLETPSAIDGRADLFALGMMAYEAVTGRLPEDGRSPGQDVPAALHEVLLRAVAPARDARFPSARELSQALERVITDAQARDAQARQAVPDLPKPAPKPAPAPRAEPVARVTPAQPAGAEHRKTRRAAYQTPVRLSWPGNKEIEGRSEDVSSGGILIVAKAELASDSLATLRLALPIDGKVITQHCMVRWVRPARSNGATDLRILGLEFLDPDRAVVKQLERYVELMGDERGGSLVPPG